MRSEYWTQVVRLVLFVLIQGLVLQRIHLGGVGAQYFAIMLYPVFIMLLPMKMNRLAIVFAGFAIGILIDLFYNSLGVHASACVFTAFIRPYVLQFFEPRGGYSANVNPTPHSLGMNWFLQYAALLLILHLLFYFSVEVFTFVYLGQILLKTLSSFALSYIAIALFALLFNPR